MEQEAKEVKPQLITKDMTIGDVVAKYPACIEALQSAGVHCVGCHVSYHETLEQGFKGHGMTDEDVERVKNSRHIRPGKGKMRNILW